ARAADRPTSHLEIPPGVLQVIEARLNPLSTEQLSLLEILSVAGRDLELGVLLDVKNGDEDTILDQLDSLVALGILVERRSGERILYQFAHRKVGEIVYDRLEAPRRAALHRRVGAALEVRFATNPVAAEVIGEQYRRAGEAGKAYRYLVFAATRIHDRGLLAEAGNLAEKAAALEAAAAELLPTAEYNKLRCDLLWVLGLVYKHRGEWPQALQAFKEVIDLAPSQEKVQRAHLELGLVYRRQGRYDAAGSEFQSVLSWARHEHERGLAIEALLGLGGLAWDQGDLDEAERLAREGMVGATDPKLIRQRAQNLLALSAVQATRGQMAAATVALSEAEGILRQLRAKREHCMALSNLSELLTMQGELAMARERARQALLVAEDLQDRLGIAGCHRLLGVVFTEAGDPDSAREHLEESLVVQGGLDVPHELCTTHYALARLWLQQASPERALPHLRTALKASQLQDPECYRPLVEGLLARTSSLTGNHASAERRLNGLDTQLQDLPVPRRSQVYVVIGMAWAAMGRRLLATEAAQEAVRLTRTRGLRTCLLEALMLLVDLADEPEASHARVEATELARDILASLGPDLGHSFRQRPGIARFLDNSPQ
ncbi:MAG: tetratricopeptide repeat protein, partial [Myxococcota bacterium]|nr:tetratricopeptide repeat protein [Myxococcota bacterium]